MLRGIRLAALVAMLPLMACAQHTGPLPIEAVLSTRQFVAFTPVEFSPDGEWVTYTARAALRPPTFDQSAENDVTDVPFYVKGSDVWIVNTRTRETRNLTAGIGANWSPTWAPDGSAIAFLSDRDGEKQAKVWLWEAARGVLRKVSNAPVRANRIVWMRGGRQLLTVLIPEDKGKPARMLGSVLGAYQSSPVSGASVVVYKAESRTNRSVGNSDPWSLDGYVGDLALLDVSSGTVQRLVRSTRIAKFALSPDGAEIAFSAPSRFEKVGSQQVLWDLSVVTVSSGHAMVISPQVRLDYDGTAFTWSPDSSRLTYLTGGPLEAAAGGGDCFMVSSKGSTPVNVTAFPAHILSTKQRLPLWDATGQFIYLIRNGTIWRTTIAHRQAKELVAIPGYQVIQFAAEDDDRVWSSSEGKSAVVLAFNREAKQSAFYMVGLETGSFTKLLENGGCFDCGDMDQRVFTDPKHAKLAFFSEDATHPEDLWIADSDFRNPERLTDLNSQMELYKMGAVRLIQWSSDDLDQLHGILLLPSDYQPGTRYPLIVWVYAGSSLSGHLHEFGSAGPGPFNLQLFATRGYAVLLPDSPSRTGTPMLDLAKTVLPGVHKVIDMGVADPDRIGVIGHSNGGYGTLALIVQTKIFRAAIEIDGLADLIADYGEMDRDGNAFAISNLEHGQDGLGGTLWDVRERYIENSPLFFLDRVETPVLVAHGGNDTTVAPFLGDELYVALRRLGKEVEYDKYEGEGHSPLDWSHANQSDLCQRMLDWFDRHLKKGAGDGR